MLRVLRRKAMPMDCQVGVRQPDVAGVAGADVPDVRVTIRRDPAQRSTQSPQDRGYFDTVALVAQKRVVWKVCHFDTYCDWFS